MKQDYVITSTVAKKKFPADEHEAGEDAFEWLTDVLNSLEDFEISDDEEEQIREATPEEVASFVGGLLKDHKLETKRAGRQIEIIVSKSKTAAPAKLRNSRPRR